MEFTRSDVNLVKDCTDETWTERLKKSLNKIKKSLSVITVEPCLALYMMTISISAMACQNLNLEKSCRVNFNYSDEICDRIMQQNTTGLDEEVKVVQALVASVVAWKFPLQTAIPAIMALFIGAWSDRTRKRKILIIAPMCGEIISNLGLLLATYFFEQVPLEVTAVIEAVPPALAGGWIILFLGMYSYMADITSTEDRTVRLGFVTVCVTFGTPAGTAVSGILLEAVGFYGVFSISILFHAVAFTYGSLRLKDVPLEASAISDQNHENSCIKRFFLADTVYETIRVIYKRKELTLSIVMVMMLNFIMVGPLYGDSQVGYLYARLKFNMTTIEYTMYTTYNTMVGILGTLIVTIIFSRLWGIKDSFIGVIACMSRIASCLVLTFAPNRGWYYAAPAINIFGNSGLTVVRSVASKIVPNSEIGQMNSILSVCEALAPSVYMPASSAIYVASLEILPGAFYLFDASLTIVAISFFFTLYVKELSRKSSASKEVEGSNCSNG